MIQCPYLALAGASALLLGGCGVRTGGTIASVSTAADAPHWPERKGDDVAVDLVEASDGVRLVTRRREPSGKLIELEHPPDSDARATIRVPIIATNIEKVWTPLPPNGHGAVTIRSFLYVGADEEAIMGQETSGQRRHLKVTFRFPRVRPLTAQEPTGASPRGTCVVLPSIVGVTNVERELLPLVEQGWTVVAFELDDFTRATRLGLKTRLRARGARDLGQLLADEIADSAFAVELVLRQLVAEDSRRSIAPLVLVGASLGAIELPSCAAYLAQSEPGLPPLKAAVLVAGGVGIDRIMLDGSIGRDWLRSMGASLPTPDDEIAWRELFASACSLAPERCLHALNGIPVLLIDARFDAVVPRTTADRLWESLGEPERWTFPLGHIGLFLLLGSETWSEVREWIDEAANDKSLQPQQPTSARPPA